MGEANLKTIASVAKEMRKLREETEKKFGDIDKRFDDVGKRAAAVEARQEKLEKSHNDLERKLVDLQRQSVKICIALSGSGIPARQVGENPQQLFCDLVRKKYNIIIDPDFDIATAHRRPEGGLIAKFLRTGPSSAFDKLAHRHGPGQRNPRPDIKVYANVLLNKHDQKIRFIAAQAKAVGTILFYETLPSGKVGILVATSQTENKMIPVNDYNDIKPYITKEVMDSIDATNKNRKKMKKAKGHAEPMDQDINEDNINALLNIGE